jgi:hypothetical protein
MRTPQTGARSMTEEGEVGSFNQMLERVFQKIIDDKILTPELRGPHNTYTASFAAFVIWAAILCPSR